MLLEIDEARQISFSNKFEMDGIVFEEPVPIYFHSIILLVPVPPAKVLARCWALMPIL
jgi:hypothetical protein